MKECNCCEYLELLRMKSYGSPESKNSILELLQFFPVRECSSNDPEEEELSTDEIIDKTLNEIICGLAMATNEEYYFTLGSEVEFDMADKNGHRVKFTVNVDKSLK